MARPKKPTELKILQGTNRKHRQVEQEPEFEKKEHYDPPLWLNQLARDSWVELVPILVNARVLTDADLRCLESYCVHYSNFINAQRQVNEEGYTLTSAGGAIVKNPACTVVKESSSEMRALAGVLGLDPAARTRINVGNKKKKKGSLGALRPAPPRKTGA